MFLNFTLSEFLTFEFSLFRVMKRVFVSTDHTYIVIAKRMYDIFPWEYLYDLRALVMYLKFIKDAILDQFQSWS